MMEDLRVATANYMMGQRIGHYSESKVKNVYYLLEDDAIIVSTTYPALENRGIINGLSGVLVGSILDRAPLPGEDSNNDGSLRSIDLTTLDESRRVQSSERKGRVTLTRIDVKELEILMK